MLSTFMAYGVHAARYTGINAVIDMLQPNHGCFLTFHRVVESAKWHSLPNQDFYIDLDFLDQTLTWLKKNHWEVVTISESIDHDYNKSRRYVNFSIDDAYIDTFKSALPLFQSHNVPLTVFVTTGIPDGSLSLWHAGMESIIQEQSSVKVPNHLSPSDGHFVTVDVSSFKAKQTLYVELERAWELLDSDFIYDQFCKMNNYDPKILRERHAATWNMMTPVSNNKFIEFGGHTVSHPHLSLLDQQEAFTEIKTCKARLEINLNIPIKHFAFPYGRKTDCGQREFDMCQRAGYITSAVTRKGLIPKNPDYYSLPRNTINGSQKSIASIEAHLNGLSGLMSSILGKV